MGILPLALNAFLYLNSNSLIQIEFGLVQQSVFIYNIYPRILLCVFLMIYVRIYFHSPEEHNKLPRKWLLKLFLYGSTITLANVNYQDEFRGLKIYLYKMVHFPRKEILRNFVVCHFWTCRVSLSGSYHQAGNKQFLTCWSHIHDCIVFDLKLR